MDTLYLDIEIPLIPLWYTIISYAERHGSVGKLQIKNLSEFEDTDEYYAGIIVETSVNK